MGSFDASFVSIGRMVMEGLGCNQHCYPVGIDDCALFMETLPMGKEITVSALEYAALKEVDKMVRVAMQKPNAAEGLVAAIQALDAVRREEAGDTAAPIIANASDVAASLIERSMQQDDR